MNNIRWAMNWLVLSAALAGAVASVTPARAQDVNPNDVPPQFITGHNAMTARSLAGSQTVLVPQSKPAPGVTVYGRRRCRRGDQACIDRVSTELWTKYPDQIRALCTATQIHSIREGMVEQDLGIQGVRNDRLTPATERLCQYGSKLKKEAAAAAKPPADPAAGPDAPPKP